MFRPSIKFAPCTVSSALSSRPSCSVAESTCGLVNVDVPKFLFRPCLDFADLSSPCFAPACDPVPPDSPACSDAAPSSTVAAPPGFVQSWPVVSSCSVSSVASRSRLAFVPPGPPGSFRSVPSCPLISFAQPLRPAFVQPSVPFGASPFCRPFFPVACFILVVVPVLFSTPFRLVVFACYALSLDCFVVVWSWFVFVHIVANLFYRMSLLTGLLQVHLSPLL